MVFSTTNGLHTKRRLTQNKEPLSPIKAGCGRTPAARPGRAQTFSYTKFSAATRNRFSASGGPSGTLSGEASGGTNQLTSVLISMHATLARSAHPWSTCRNQKCDRRATAGDSKRTPPRATRGQHRGLGRDPRLAIHHVRCTAHNRRRNTRPDIVRSEYPNLRPSPAL